MRNYVFEARKLAGITQADAAHEIGLSQSTYSTKERLNEFTMMELKKLDKLFGQGVLERVKNESNVLGEPGVPYGNTDFTKLLSIVNRSISMQEAGLIAQVDIISRLSGKSYDEAFKELSKLYEDKTGKKLVIYK